MMTRRPSFSAVRRPEHRELAPCAQGAVEPEHHRAGGVAELGVAKAATVGQVELAFRARLFDARNQRGMPKTTAQSHWFSESRRLAGQPIADIALATHRFPAVGAMFASDSAPLCRGDQTGASRVTGCWMMCVPHFGLCSRCCVWIPLACKRWPPAGALRWVASTRRRRRRGWDCPVRPARRQSMPPTSTWRRSPLGWLRGSVNARRASSKPTPAPRPGSCFDSRGGCCLPAGDRRVAMAAVAGPLACQPY